MINDSSPYLWSLKVFFVINFFSPHLKAKSLCYSEFRITIFCFQCIDHFPGYIRVYSIAFIISSHFIDYFLVIWVQLTRVQSLKVVYHSFPSRQSFSLDLRKDDKIQGFIRLADCTCSHLIPQVKFKLWVFIGSYSNRESDFYNSGGGWLVLSSLTSLISP